MSDKHKDLVDFALCCPICDANRNFAEVINCIIIKRRREFLSIYGSSPKYVILPLHWYALLERNIVIVTEDKMTYMGMQICESPACKGLADIAVY